MQPVFDLNSYDTRFFINGKGKGKGKGYSFISHLKRVSLYLLYLPCIVWKWVDRFESIKTTGPNLGYLSPLYIELVELQLLFSWLFFFF